MVLYERASRLAIAAARPAPRPNRLRVYWAWHTTIPVSREISGADQSKPFWLVLLTEHKALHCYIYAPNAVYRCLVAGQLYPSCGFSSADCRCFQVFNPCRAIHRTAFVHYTALTDRDFLIRMASSCEIFMIKVNFYWYLGLDSFPR